MIMLPLVILVTSVLNHVTSEGVCPRAEIACAGTCAERLDTHMDHAAAARACTTMSKRTYMGSRTNDEMEGSCSVVVGERETQYIWSRYELREGLVVDEVGVKIKQMNWGIKYCGGVNQLGNFMAQPCSWSKQAICVSNTAQYDKDNIHSCQGEYYWVADRSDLTHDTAVQYCTQNNMVLAEPYNNARKSCFRNVLQRRGVNNAWIDYRISGATQSIRPWDMEYCIKVNMVNAYMVDRCETLLPVTCTTFGELETTSDVVQMGKSATVSCLCPNCSLNDIEWTDGMTTWRSGDSVGDISVVTVPIRKGVTSTLTLANTKLDQVFICTRRSAYTDSVIYSRASVDVYNLQSSQHNVFYGSRITLSCSFVNDKHLEIERVEWSDRRDNNDLSGRARTSYTGNTVSSTLEINSEHYTHDVRCTFLIGQGNEETQYSGIVKIIVYKIEGQDEIVPADAETILRCSLEEHTGRGVDLEPPTHVDWVYSGTNAISSELDNPYQAVLRRSMRTGRDEYTCRFLFNNGDTLSKTLTVTAFDFEGVPAVVANGSTAYLDCKYSRGKQPDQPLWWEREGVKISDGKRYLGERYQITSNFATQDSVYIATTRVAISNATYNANYQCAIRVNGRTWRKEIPLTVYLGFFIAPNVTITESVDEETGELVVRCAVWANPRPTLQLFIGNFAHDGIMMNKDNETSVTARVDQTCSGQQYRCQSSNDKGTVSTVTKSKLALKCGFFQKLSLTVWCIIGGVVLLLILLIVVISCCCCCRNKKLKKEVEYQRDVLSGTDGASTHYSGSRSVAPKVKGSLYEDMYSEIGNVYDPPAKSPAYQEPYAETGPMSPSLMSPQYQRIDADYDYQRIDSDYEPAPTLFTTRSKSRDNLFSPALSKKPSTAFSYLNMKERDYAPSGASKDPADSTLYDQGAPGKMNPFSNTVKRTSDFDDEISTITARIPPSEISDSGPPVAILSPRGWEMSAEPPMFSPPACRRTARPERHPNDPWHEAQEKVKNWNLPPNGDHDGSEDEGTYPGKPRWAAPSTVGGSTGKSSATLDTISITPTYLQKNRFPASRAHPEDRMAHCVSPPPSTYAASSVGPSASQYAPSMAGPRPAGGMVAPAFNLDQLSSVDVPEDDDTLDRRVKTSHPVQVLPMPNKLASNKSVTSRPLRTTEF